MRLALSPWLSKIVPVTSPILTIGSNQMRSPRGSPNRFIRHVHSRTGTCCANFYRHSIHYIPFSRNLTPHNQFGQQRRAGKFFRDHRYHCHKGRSPIEIRVYVRKVWTSLGADLTPLSHPTKLHDSPAKIIALPDRIAGCVCPLHRIATPGDSRTVHRSNHVCRG